MSDTSLSLSSTMWTVFLRESDCQMVDASRSTHVVPRLLASYSRPTVGPRVPLRADTTSVTKKTVAESAPHGNELGSTTNPDASSMCGSSRAWLLSWVSSWG